MSLKHFEISFKVKAFTNLNQHVRIVGSIEQLGHWDPLKGLKLNTNMNDYPIWSSSAPILLPKGKSKLRKLFIRLGTKFEFKVVYFENDHVTTWENLPNDINRRYQVKFYKVALNCITGDPTVRVNVLEKVLDTDNMTSNDFSNHSFFFEITDLF